MFDAQTDPDRTMPLTFPLVVLDFEATALALTSYPIEVGVAVLKKPGAKIRSWSSLIKPDPRWDMAAQWDRDAERLHGINQRMLREGKHPRAVMAELNALIPSGTTVWCDGGLYDAHWLATLTQASSFVASFELGDLGAELRRGDGQVLNRYLAASADQLRPHRAGVDAVLICAALAAAIAH
ncbi:MAG: hypothetical protein BGO57_04135 [Sphingomonadales bacterium 63-6]|nr:MAG: hypothetical protein BGO57_04135 [Sphingomonadales bacterium 63-6]